VAAQAAVGQLHSVAFRIVNPANGKPILTGESGTVSLYGPAATTALVSGTALAHQGNGYWGATFAGSLLTTPGTYRWVTSAITGTVALEAQSGEFVVGYGGANAWTLRELVVSIRHALRDGFEGTATGNGSTTTLVDSTYARGSNSDWLGSELLILEPGASDPNPVTVSGFTASTGTFTWPASQAVTSTVTGLNYVLGNLGGRGFTHRAILSAIAYACRKVGASVRVADEVSLAFDTSTAQYLVPAVFASVTGLAYQPSGSNPGTWLPIADRYWRFDPVRQRVQFTRYATGYASGRLYSSGYGIPNGAALRLEGTAVPSVPGALAETVEADGARVRDLALIELQTWSPAPEHRQAALMRAARGGARVGRLP